MKKRYLKQLLAFVLCAFAVLNSAAAFAAGSNETAASGITVESANGAGDSVDRFGGRVGSFAPCEQRTFCKGTVAADDFFNASEWCGDSCAGDRDAFFAHKAERRKLLHRA